MWFWFIPIWYGGKEQFAEVEVEFVRSDNLKGVLLPQPSWQCIPDLDSTGLCQG